MRKLNIFLILLLSALLTVSAYMIWKEISIQQREKKEFDELLEIIEPTNTEKPKEETDGVISGTDDETEPPVTEPEEQGRNLDPLFEKNAECIGWLCIDGTNINYPVMYTPSNINTSNYVDPSTKNNLDLVKWSEFAADKGWGYVWGTYGTVLSPDFLESKIIQYPDEVGGKEDFIRENWLGKRTADCVGLIKGYSWYDTASQMTILVSNGMPDIGADTMYENATEKGTIDTIPEIPGLAVWKEGHLQAKVVLQVGH